MKIEHLDEGVGRIVKGVNTTPDVGVDQTRIEAAKFSSTFFSALNMSPLPCFLGCGVVSSKLCPPSIIAHSAAV